jgi:hypothetical protein
MRHFDLDIEFSLFVLSIFSRLQQPMAGDNRHQLLVQQQSGQSPLLQQQLSSLQVVARTAG